MAVVPGGAWAAGHTTTLTSNGVAAAAGWIDPTNPADYVFGNINLYGSGSAAQPAYFLVAFVQDTNGTLANGGIGPIPASSVKISGGSVTSGKLVVHLEVDTCGLDPAVFVTTRTCGIVSATWTEVPGYRVTTHGTQDYVFGPVTTHVAGTNEATLAIPQGTVLGSTILDYGDSQIGMNRQVTVTIQFP